MKFLGAVLLLGAGAAGWLLMQDEAIPPNEFSSGADAMASTAPAARETRTAATVYVGYDPTTFDATRGYDRERVEGALLDWKTSHDGYAITYQEAVYKGPLVIGYRLEFEPTDTEPEVEVVRVPGTS